MIAEGKYSALGLYDIRTMSEFGDTLDKITGKVERLKKAFDLASMSGADLKQLFSDYPTYYYIIRHTPVETCDRNQLIFHHHPAIL